MKAWKLLMVLSLAYLLSLLFLSCAEGDDEEGARSGSYSPPENDGDDDSDDDYLDDDTNDNTDDDDTGEPNFDFSAEALVMNIEWDVYHHSLLILSLDSKRLQWMLNLDWDNGEIFLNGESLPLFEIQIIELVEGQNTLLYKNGEYEEELLVKFLDDLTITSETVNIQGGVGQFQIPCSAGSCVPEIIVLENKGDEALEGIQLRSQNDAPLRTYEEFQSWLPNQNNLADLAEVNLGITRKHLFSSSPSWFNDLRGNLFPESFRDTGMDFCSGIATAMSRLFWMEGLQPDVGEVRLQPIDEHVTMEYWDAEGGHWFDPYYCVWGEEDGLVLPFSVVASDPERYILPWAGSADEGPCGGDLNWLVTSVKNGSDNNPELPFDFSTLTGTEGGFNIEASHILTLMPNHTGKAFRICPQGREEECIRFPNEETVGSFIDEWTVTGLTEIVYSQTYPLHAVIVSGFSDELVGDTVPVSLMFGSEQIQSINAEILPGGKINLSPWFIHDVNHGVIRSFNLDFGFGFTEIYQIQVVGQFARRSWPSSSEIIIESFNDGELDVAAYTDQNVEPYIGAGVIWGHEEWKGEYSSPSPLDLPSNGKSFATLHVWVVGSLDENHVRRVPGHFVEVIPSSLSLKLKPPNELYHLTREAVPSQWTGTLRNMSHDGITTPWQVRCISPGNYTIDVHFDGEKIETISVSCN